MLRIALPRYASRVGLVLAAVAVAIAARSPDALATIDQQTLQGLLTEFLSCTTAADDRSPCNMFVGRALKRAYGIGDFEQPPGSDKFLSANQIAASVATSGDWVALGDATDQAALTQAAAYAGQGRAVLAVRSGSPNGHVAMILPGALIPSSNWHLNVPSSASFFLDNPQGSYVGKALSFAFKQPDGVKLYSHEKAG